MIAVFKLPRLCLVALLAASFLVPAAYAQKWNRLAPFPEPSEELWGAGAGGKLYVFGGLAPGWKPKSMVYEYDPDNDTWTRKKNMPLGSHHVAAAELNGKIYMMGGFKYPDAGKPGWQPIDNAWEYDPVKDAWKALAPMPTKRGSPNAVVHGGKIYVIGGASMHPGSKDLVHPGVRPARGYNEVYDPTQKLGDPQPMPRPQSSAAGWRHKITSRGRIGATL